MGYVIAGAIGVVLLAIILWAGRDDDPAEGVLRNSLRGVLVLGGIVAVFGTIVWVSTYGN